MAETERAQWDSGVQFILTCIGYAVGLGNIWRFPSLAYENGGGAFLIPYLICSFGVGFPLLYLEMSLGQFARGMKVETLMEIDTFSGGPAVIYGRIRPLFQGIGWCMASLSLLVSVYYNVIVSWILIYLGIIITGRSDEWASCRNEFNTAYCSSTLENERCAYEIGGTNATEWAFFFNGSCHYGTNEEMVKQRDEFYAQTLPPVSPAEEFFENYVLEKTKTIDEMGGFNLKVVAALAIAWILTCLVLCKGVKIMGKLSTFTATIPYAIIVLFFVRGVTLDGAEEGLKFYMTQPNMTKIYEITTWKTAATHVCYSLAIGFGGLMSLSSFNGHHHNCFKDALIITVADGFMSMFGGTAVFSVLGFMAKQLNSNIDDVVQSGTGLAFIAYPEAMSRMPMPWLWSLLFFSMLFILGISSQFGLAEVMITALYDQCPSLRKHKTYIAIGVCMLLFLMGLIMTTRAGIFYFNLFDSYSASFTLMLLIIFEILLVIYIYGNYRNTTFSLDDLGLHEYLKDLRSMMGTPSSWLGRIFGSSGTYVQLIWRFVAPIEAALVFYAVLNNQIDHLPTYGKKERMIYYPEWSLNFGWMLSLVPLITLPFFVVYNLIKFQRQRRYFDMCDEEHDDDQIFVAARLRPLPQRNLRPCLKIENSNLIFNGQTTRYTFDVALNDSCEQRLVFEKVAKKILDGCLEGYNGTIFAYGQTASGKTYTMYGANHDDPEFKTKMGIVPRSVQFLFDELNKRREMSGDEVFNYQIKASFVELYKEELIDLLDPKMKPKIRKLNETVELTDATICLCTNVTEVMELIKLGNEHRHVSETAMNERSSRSHSIITIFLTVESMQKQIVRRINCRLNLVDLAGSENAKDSKVDGQQFKEMQKINLSLLTLGNVIRKLTLNTPAKHIPYRDSKLTWFLCDSLGGNSRTAFVVNLHSDAKNVTMTTKSINFAQSLRKIKKRTARQRELEAVKERNEDVEFEKVELQSKVQGFEQQLIDKEVEVDVWKEKYAHLEVQMQEEKPLELNTIVERFNSFTNQAEEIFKKYVQASKPEFDRASLQRKLLIDQMNTFGARLATFCAPTVLKGKERRRTNVGCGRAPIIPGSSAAVFKVMFDEDTNEKENQEANGENTNFTTKKNAREEDILRLRDDLMELRKTREKEYKTMTDQLNKMQNRLATKQEECRNWRKKFETESTEKRKLAHELKDAKKKLKDYEEELESLRARITELSEELDICAEENSKLKKDQDAHNDTITDYEGELNSKGVELQEFRDQMADELINVKASLEKVVKERDDLQKQVVSLTSSRDKIQYVNRLRGEVVFSQKENQALKEKIEKLEALIAGSKE
ncbi:Snf-9 [Aphelenchoides besseyi]|nr:Snf-9 [Aphelenchoides besseyi]